MLHFIKKLTFLALFSFAFKTYGFSRIHDFETTRLKGTSGTGVGSILLEEAAILNPATLSFFNQSSLYGSYNGGDFSAVENSPNLDKKKEWGFILSDANPGLSGAAHYITQDEGFSKRTRYGLSLSGIVGKTSALGFGYRKTTDKLGSSNLNKLKKDYHQVSLGVIHVISQNLSFGIVAYDMFKGNSVDSKAVAGFQYNFAQAVALLGDLGSKWDQNLSDNLVYRAAIQFNVFNDFFLRVGMFNDKSFNERGNSFGLSWVQPRLSLDFSVKNSKIQKDTVKNQNPYDLKETSFGLSLRF